MTGKQLLQQTIDYLEEQDGPDPQWVRGELLQRAYMLLAEPEEWVASLFLGDREEFEKDPDLASWLASLEKELAEAEDPGQILVENLYNSLQHHYPGFGLQRR
jgi:hypothetical protein